MQETHQNQTREAHPEFLVCANPSGTPCPGCHVVNVERDRKEEEGAEGWNHVSYSDHLLGGEHQKTDGETVMAALAGFYPFTPNHKHLPPSNEGDSSLSTWLHRMCTKICVRIALVTAEMTGQDWKQAYHQVFYQWPIFHSYYPAVRMRDLHSACWQHQPLETNASENGSQSPTLNIKAMNMHKAQLPPSLAHNLATGLRG